MCLGVGVSGVTVWMNVNDYTSKPPTQEHTQIPAHPPVAVARGAAALEGVEHEEQNRELRGVLHQHVDVPEVAPAVGERGQGLVLCIDF